MPTPSTHNDLAGLLRDATVDALRDSVRRHMPTGPLRDYYQWGLDPAQPRQPQFLQVTGVAQLANLYAGLAQDLVDEALQPKISELLARIAVYQTYEIVSDNLALGLAGRTPAEPDGGRAATRRQLLRAFNNAMTVRLRGGGPADLLLASERQRAQRLSILDQSLAGQAHRELAARLPGRPSVEDIERGVWPALVANIEAAAEVAGTLDGTLLGPLVTDGLAERYRGVSRTLSPRHLSRLELAAIGAHTILVAPTLAYCIGIVADLAEPAPGLAGVVADGSLADLLQDAALLIRLLNDAGPVLLDLSPARRRAALSPIRLRRGSVPLEDLMPDDPPFSRLAKDLRHGEFNIILYAARRAADLRAAVAALESDLDYYGRLYHLHRTRLAAGLARLTRRLADDRPAELIRRFMTFHSTLYANLYTETQGEYAV